MKKKLSMLIACLVVFGLILTGCGSGDDDDSDNGKKVVRIGYQKSDPFFIVKSRGTLEGQLKKIGYKVEWREFQDGTALLEALNSGSIDLGRTGNTPPIFSQASGSTLKYVAAGASKYQGSGILVPKDSSIQSVSDLKGKKVAYSRGSSSHYLIIKALESAGLSIDDIQSVDLNPGDARIAFEQGQVDAWVVWDPYTASAQVNSGAKMLVNGEGLTTDRDFFIATESFAKNHKDVVDTVIKEVADSMDWANNHHSELIDLLAKALKMDKESVTMAVERRVYGVDKINDDIMKEQQDIADLFYKLDIIPKEIDVKEAMTD